MPNSLEVYGRTNGFNFKEVLVLLERLREFKANFDKAFDFVIKAGRTSRSARDPIYAVATIDSELFIGKYCQKAREWRKHGTAPLKTIGGIASAILGDEIILTGGYIASSGNSNDVS